LLDDSLSQPHADTAQPRQDGKRGRADDDDGGGGGGGAKRRTGAGGGGGATA
jgi:hypothetical protein